MEREMEEKRAGQRAKAGENVAYLLLCSDNTLYCGWTNDLDRRVKAHNEGKGAKYTKGRRPVTLVYWEVFSTKQEAMRREAAIKRLSRQEKERLIQCASFTHASGHEAVHHHIMTEASAHNEQMENFV